MPEIIEKTESSPEPKSSPSNNLISDVYFGTSEESFLKASNVDWTQILPYNPDDLWQKTGDYSIYEDMCHDDQVSVCLQVKKDLIIGSGFEIVPGDLGQDEIIKNLKYILDYTLEYPFLEMISEILTGFEFGFSLSEKIFKVLPGGNLALKAIKTRHPQSWMIYQDDFGNIEKYVQSGFKGDIIIDKKKLIHFVNNPKFGNPYGNSDLRNCYAAWFAKRQAIRYYGIFLEKAASPTPVGRYDKNAPESAITKIFNSLKRLQSSTALAIPKEIEVEFLETTNTGDAYSKAINIFNLFIGRSLFIPDLLGLAGSETSGGSYSLGKEQINIFFMHINRKREIIESLINYHIIQPMIIYNHGFIEKMPKLKFKPLDDNKAIELAKIWLEAVRGKIYAANDDEINHFRKLVKFPEGDIKENEEQISTSITSEISNNTDDEQKNSEEKSENGNNASGDEINTESDKTEDEQQSKKKEFKQHKETPPTPGNYAKKVDFKAIETKLDDHLNSLTAEVLPITNKIIIDLLDQIQKKKIIETQNISKIDELNVKYLKELKIIFKDSFTELYKDGKILAQKELIKSDYATPLPSDKFLKAIEDETFQYIGDYKYNITKNIRLRLIEAIKDGESLALVAEDIKNKGKKLSQTSVERFARTKFTEVMNRARVDFFEDSDIVAAYQYSAILDDVTTPICSGLHGKIFQKGTQPIPPMHFNCRSTLIPITRYEKFNISQDVEGEPIDKFIEENVGTGFSIYTKKELKLETSGTDISFKSENILDNSELITYSRKEIPYAKVFIIYKDDSKTEVLSTETFEINGD